MKHLNTISSLSMLINPNLAFESCRVDTSCPRGFRTYTMVGKVAHPTLYIRRPPCYTKEAVTAGVLRLKLKVSCKQQLLATVPSAAGWGQCAGLCHARMCASPHRRAIFQPINSASTKSNIIFVPLAAARRWDRVHITVWRC